MKRRKCKECGGIDEPGFMIVTPLGDAEHFASELCVARLQREVRDLRKAVRDLIENATQYRGPSPDWQRRIYARSCVKRAMKEKEAR